MGVYIKGMEMPKGRATCPYCDRAWNKPKCKAKSVQGRFMEQRLNLDRTRQKWCPLVYIPEHGRLIDESAIDLSKYEKAAHDALHNGKGSILYDSGVLAGARAITQLVRRAPTIIPSDTAEEGET